MKNTALSLALIFALSLPAAAGIGDPLNGPRPPTRSGPAPTPTPPPNPADFTYQAVHENIGLTKGEIYDRAIDWIAKNFADSKAVLEVKDREGGKIIGKASTRVREATARIPCRFTLTLEIKDGRYRSTYENFVFQYSTGNMVVTHKAMLDRIKAEGLKPLDEELDAAVRAKNPDAW